MKKLFLTLLLLPLSVSAEGCFVNFNNPAYCSTETLFCSYNYTVDKARYGSQIAGACDGWGKALDGWQNASDGWDECLTAYKLKNAENVRNLNEYNQCAVDFNAQLELLIKLRKRIRRLKKKIRRLR